MKLHTKISYLKSALRILGLTLLFYLPITGIIILIIAEIIGVLEEAIL